MQVDCLLFAAVDREVQVHRDHAEVVFGARLGKHFFKVRGFLVTPGFVEGDHGRLIGENGDVVFVRTAIRFAVDADQFDVVARVVRDG